MKTLLLLLTLLATPLFALYNGNPSAPNMPELGLYIDNASWWGIKWGYQWDYTFNKWIKIDNPQKSKVRDVWDNYQAYKNFGVFTFNWIDRVEASAQLGAMSAQLATRPLPNIREGFETKEQMAWGAGGRIILVYWEELVMGVNAIYNGAFLDIDRITQNGALIPQTKARMSYHEWQVGINFSREIGPLIPYIGAAYASMRTHLKHLPDPLILSGRQTLKNRQPFMFLIGLGLTKGRIFALNIESRLSAEKAIALSGDLRF